MEKWSNLQNLDERVNAVLQEGKDVIESEFVTLLQLGFYFIFCFLFFNICIILLLLLQLFQRKKRNVIDSFYSTCTISITIILILITLFQSLDTSLIFHFISYYSFHTSFLFFLSFFKIGIIWHDFIP